MNNFFDRRPDDVFTTKPHPSYAHVQRMTDDELKKLSKELRASAALKTAAGWDESQHPRDERGQFTETSDVISDVAQAEIIESFLTNKPLTPESIEEAVRARFDHQPIPFYHGTSSQAVKDIKKNGIKPKGSVGADAWGFQKVGKLPEDVMGFSEAEIASRKASVFVTSDEKAAEQFADFARQMNPGSDPVVLKVKIPADEIVADKASPPFAAFQHSGVIPPQWIEDIKVVEPPKERLVKVIGEKLLADRGVVFYIVFLASDKEPRIAGDVEGHPFHGNQYTDAVGGSDKVFTTKESTTVDTADGRVTFTTGHPVTFPYFHNTEPAPNFGSRFGQDIEPAGRYVIVREKGVDPPATNKFRPNASWEAGTITFNNPLVIRGDGSYGPGGWKAKLSKAYGDKRGKRLSQAVRKDGYDGIVSVDLGPSEIVDLRMIRVASHRETALHAIADSYHPRLKAAFQIAFTRARKVASPHNINAALDALTNALDETLAPTLRKIVIDGGVAAVGMMPKIKTAEFRAADGPLLMSFNKKNPRVAAWTRKHAAELITQISDTTREAIKAALIEAEDSGEDPSDAIAAAIGDEARADVIARTESMRAVHAGQREAWDQAVDEGLLDPEAQRVWIATGDDLTCPICEGLDGKVADLDGQYDGEYDAPPAHPNCRCTEGISG